MKMAERRLRAIVSGRVQGVYFRAHTKEEAVKLDLTGFARNLDDGRVEVVAEGPEVKLRKLSEWLKRGPPAASVASLEVSWSEASREFNSFEVTY